MSKVILLKWELIMTNINWKYIKSQLQEISKTLQPITKNNEVNIYFMISIITNKLYHEKSKMKTIMDTLNNLNQK